MFHDASNLIALNSSPSIYSEYRRKALNYTLDVINKNKSIKEDESEQAFAIFGDFNFRLDLKPLVDVSISLLIRVVKVFKLIILFYRLIH